MKNRSSVSLSGFEALKPQEAKKVKKQIRFVLEQLSLEHLLLTVHLCDDEEIRVLNKQYRNKDKPTDVLSFEVADSSDDPFFEIVLGDIVISAETAQRQSEEAGHSLYEELCVLFVHGLLHLLDYDHERSASEAIRQAEAELHLLSLMEIPVETALIRRLFSCVEKGNDEKSS